MSRIKLAGIASAGVVIGIAVYAALAGKWANVPATDTVQQVAPNKVASTLSDERRFSWRGINFIYPSGWQAEIWKYGSAAMEQEGKEGEVGFQVFKQGSTSQPGSRHFSAEFYIEAGGPQSGGDTCATTERSYTLCTDLPINHGKYEQATIMMITRSSNEETRAVFREISLSAKRL